METATGISAVTEALTTGLADIGNQAMSAIGSIMPGALVVMGGMLVVALGIKAFKKVTGR